ncbi:unnamed protein product [Paramecium sonneborni]|uniref:Uncharacterized protein n=1 Tax=Paramecium sonneborni TaxID=65129 RepID=A0A8S1RBI9_9CILI|nr:unnamed protein product [Paramecium sonneborni]
MQNQAGWNLLPNPIIFDIKEKTTSFCLAQLPAQARKVKLFIALQSGECKGDHTVTWSLFTKVDKIKVMGHPYHQGAWNTSSDNCTLRLDDSKIIEVSKCGSFPKGNFSIQVEVLGYK